MGITIESGLLQAPCPATLIDRDHTVGLWMQETCLNGAGSRTAGEEDHEAFKVAMYGRQFRRPLLRIPTQVAQIGRMRQEDPATFVRCHSYSFLE